MKANGKKSRIARLGTESKRRDASDPLEHKLMKPTVLSIRPSVEIAHQTLHNSSQEMPKPRSLLTRIPYWQCASSVVNTRRP